MRQDNGNASREERIKEPFLRRRITAQARAKNGIPVGLLNIGLALDGASIAAQTRIEHGQPGQSIVGVDALAFPCLYFLIKRDSIAGVIGDFDRQERTQLRQLIALV